MLIDADEISDMPVGKTIKREASGHALATVHRDSKSRWTMSCAWPGTLNNAQVKLSAIQLKDPAVVQRELTKALRTIFGK
ncbi:MAG TPA: hypothetical protein VGH72_33625 [Pseudonocardia sp.]|jgi:hypothetical protein